MQVATAELSPRARTVSLKYMRHDDKAGAKKSERDCYVEHGTHPYSRHASYIKPRRFQDDYVVS